jgi:RNase H-fold protein (predicted Holliday junction resolvase)
VVAGLVVAIVDLLAIREVVAVVVGLPTRAETPLEVLQRNRHKILELLV